MTELWKTAEGFPDYEVSSSGRVRRAVSMRNSHVGRTISGYVNQQGYRAVMLVCPRKKHRLVLLHRLLAATFFGPAPDGKPIVRHLDGDRLTNNIENLSWGSYAENSQDSLRHGTMPLGEDRHCAKLTADKVVQIRKLCADGASRREIAARFGVSRDHVGVIARRKSWAHVA